jgi:hypothetical protein
VASVGATKKLTHKPAAPNSAASAQNQGIILPASG